MVGNLRSRIGLLLYVLNAYGIKVALVMPHFFVGCAPRTDLDGDNTFVIRKLSLVNFWFNFLGWSFALDGDFIWNERRFISQARLKSG
jgi:hypothetical protein